jgi:hypothetical protein
VAEPFSRVVTVDFSANATPKLGADSIWIAEATLSHTRVANVATRRELEDRLGELSTLPGRTLVIIDVALGWPAGLARQLGVHPQSRAAMAGLLADMVVEGPRNANNRFEVANALNERSGVALFWGHPHGRRYRWLSATKQPPRGLDRWEGHHLRRLERACGGTIKSPLQLYGNGSVGSQSMLAQAMVERLRRSGVDLAVWPYDGDDARLVVAEEFFSRPVFVQRPASCRDESQVRAVARAFVGDLRAGNDPFSIVDLDVLRGVARREVLREEGWLARLAVEAA